MVDSGDQYKKLAEVCEKHKIPYGFYFYSTALTFEEADALLHQKRGHRLDIKKGHYQLVTLDKIKEMKEKIAGHSDQWYIIFNQEI